MTYRQLYAAMRGNAGDSILGIAANAVAAQMLTQFNPETGNPDAVVNPGHWAVTELTIYPNPTGTGPRFMAA